MLFIFKCLDSSFHCIHNLFIINLISNSNSHSFLPFSCRWTVLYSWSQLKMKVAAVSNQIQNRKTKIKHNLILPFGNSIWLLANQDAIGAWLRNIITFFSSSLLLLASETHEVPEKLDPSLWKFSTLLSKNAASTKLFIHTLAKYVPKLNPNLGLHSPSFSLCWQFQHLQHTSAEITSALR